MDNTEETKLRISQLKDGIKLCARVVPNSSKSEIVGVIEGCLKIKLKAPPIEGRANEELIKFLSKFLSVPKSSICIASGETSKNKTLHIKGSYAEMETKISNILKPL